MRSARGSLGLPQCMLHGPCFRRDELDRKALLGRAHRVFLPNILLHGLRPRATIRFQMDRGRRIPLHHHPLGKLLLFILIFKPPARLPASALRTFHIGIPKIIIRGRVAAPAPLTFPCLLRRMNIERESAPAAGGARTRPHPLIGHPPHLNSFKKAALQPTMQTTSKACTVAQDPAEVDPDALPPAIARIPRSESPGTSPGPRKPSQSPPPSMARPSRNTGNVTAAIS